MINPIEFEINKIYSKIDKIAKKGKDNYIEYHAYFEELVKNGKYSYLKECLEIKYKCDVSFYDLPTAKQKSWKEILFYTTTPFQDYIKKTLKEKELVQSGVEYFKDIPSTKATVEDINGTGCELKVNLVDDYVDTISVLRSGSGYSGSASVVIIGGTGTASATPVIKAGKVYSILVTATGSGHNRTPKVGKIEEVDEYEIPITNKFSKDLYQRLIKNKTTYLIATKDGFTYSATFSTWNTDYTYDKNIFNLYNSALNYLIS